MALRLELALRDSVKALRDSVKALRDSVKAGVGSPAPPRAQTLRAQASTVERHPAKAAAAAWKDAWVAYLGRSAREPVAHAQAQGSTAERRLHAEVCLVGGRGGGCRYTHALREPPSGNPSSKSPRVSPLE